MKLVTIGPAAPGLRAMPAAALPAVSPWPMPQPSPARPTARPAPTPSRPRPPPEPPPSSAKAARGTSAKHRLQTTILANFRIAFPSLVVRSDRADERLLVRLLQRLPDVDHGQEREDERL